MPKISSALLKRFGFLPTRKASPTSTAPINLPPSLALLAPTFPTFSALTVEAGKLQPERTKRDGLFAALLKDPRVLLQDLLDSPSKYEDGVASLLQDLVGGRRSLEDLSPAEMQLLDRAVLDYTRPIKIPAPKPVPAPSPRAQETKDRDVEYPMGDKAPSLDGLEPYWWLK